MTEHVSPALTAISCRCTCGDGGSIARDRGFGSLLDSFLAPPLSPSSRAQDGRVGIGNWFGFLDPLAGFQLKQLLADLQASLELERRMKEQIQSAIREPDPSRGTPNRFADASSRDTGPRRIGTRPAATRATPATPAAPAPPASPGTPAAKAAPAMPATSPTPAAPASPAPDTQAAGPAEGAPGTCCDERSHASHGSTVSAPAAAPPSAPPAGTERPAPSPATATRPVHRAHHRFGDHLR